MPQIKQGWPVAQAQVTNREFGNCAEPLIVRLDTERMAPRVIRVKLHPMPRPLSKVHEQGVIVTVSTRRHEALSCATATRSCIRIGLEEIKRIRTWRSETKLRGAVADGRANQVADVRRIAKRFRQYSGHRTCLALLNAREECPLSSVVFERNASSAGGLTRKCSIENGQWLFSRELAAHRRIVSKRVNPVRLVDGQIGLRVLEFAQESVLDDIDFIRIDVNPLMDASVSHISDFEHIAVAKLPLNPEVPFLNVWLLDVGIESGAAPEVAPSVIRLRDRCRISRW